MVDRIEVVRGPGSAVHGADAFAGVINIVTMSRAKVGALESGMGYGSFDTSDLWLRHGSTLAGWDTTFSLEYRHSNGDDERIIERDLQNTLDRRLNIPRGLAPASLAPGEAQTQYTLYDASLSLAKGNFSGKLRGEIGKERGLGAGLSSVLDDYGRIDSQVFSGDLGYRYRESPDWDLNLEFRYKYEKFDSLARMFPPGALLPIAADGNVAGAGVPVRALVLFKDGLFGEPIITDHFMHTELSSVYEGFSNHRLRLAAGFAWTEVETDNYKNFGPGVLDTSSLAPPPAINVVDGSLTHLDHSSPYIFMSNQDRHSYNISLQDEWKFDPQCELTAGARYDHYSDFDGTFNPRAALVGRLTPEVTAKLMYGRAFRAPTFSEQFLKNNPSSLGNANLRPEVIDTWELALDYRPAPRFRTTLNLFHYKIKDVIDNLPVAGSSNIAAQNARDQKGRGFELETEWQAAASLLVKGYVAYQRSWNDDTGEIVADAPEIQYYLNPQWSFLPGWSLDGQYYLVTNRHRSAADTKAGRADIDDYDLVHLCLQRRNIAKQWDVKLKIRNLFDEDAREPAPANIPYDFPLEGRSFWGEIVYHY